MLYNHKTYKTNKTMSKSKEKACGGTQPRCRRKASRLAAFPQPKYGFESFAGFVTKRNQSTNN